MSTYTIGAAGDYLSFADFEAAVSTPEVGGTILEMLDDTQTADHAFTNSNYTGEPLTIKAVAGQEANGIGAGALVAGRIETTITSSLFTVQDLRLRNLRINGATSEPNRPEFHRCDIGYDASGIGNVGLVSASSSSFGIFNNCILRDGPYDGFTSSAASQVTFEKCTFVDMTRYGSLRAINTNTLIVQSGGGIDFHTTTTGTDFLAASDTTGTGQAATTGFDNLDKYDHLIDYDGGDYNLAPGSFLNTAGQGGGRIGAQLSITSQGPNVTGPGTGVETQLIVAEGTEMAADVGLNLITDSAGYPQTIDSFTTTTMNYIAESGQNFLRINQGGPLTGVPLIPTVSAVGITAPVVSQQVNNGVDTPNSKTIAFSAFTNVHVIQTMVDQADTSIGSLFESSIITVENNMQCVIPTEVDGVTIVPNSDGTFLVDLDQSFTLRALYYSPANGQWSTHEISVLDTSAGPPPDDEAYRTVMPLETDLSFIEPFGIGVATFTRGTLATYIDANDGLLKTAGTNVARFETEGYLNEGISTNLILQSEDFTTTWAQIRNTIMPDVITSPDGVSLADASAANTDNSNHRNQQAFTFSAGTYTASCFVKAGDKNFCYMTVESSDPNNNTVYFDLANGVVGTVKSGISSASITPLVNDWFLVTATRTTAGSASFAAISWAAEDNNSVFIGDGSTIDGHQWGFQLELLPFSTSYVATTIAPVEREQDQLTIPSANIDQSREHSLAYNNRALPGSPGTLGIQIVVRAATTSTNSRWQISGNGSIGNQWDGVNLPSGSNAGDATVYRHLTTQPNNGAEGVQYIDGVAGGVTSGAIADPALNQIDIGHSTGSNVVYGHITNLRIYNRVLTDEEAVDEGTQLPPVNPDVERILKRVILKATVGRPYLRDFDDYIDGIAEEWSFFNLPDGLTADGSVVSGIPTTYGTILSTITYGNSPPTGVEWYVGYRRNLNGFWDEFLTDEGIAAGSIGSRQAQLLDSLILAADKAPSLNGKWMQFLEEKGFVAPSFQGRQKDWITATVVPPNSRQHLDTLIMTWLISLL